MVKKNPQFEAFFALKANYKSIDTTTSDSPCSVLTIGTQLDLTISKILNILPVTDPRLNHTFKLSRFVFESLILILKEALI